MQFKVPQDVQREDTIVGPLTFKQLIICAVGGGLTYAVYTILVKGGHSWPVWILPVLFCGSITISFAFVKVHDMTFMRYVLSLFVFHFLPKKRVWVKGSAEVLVSYEETKIQINTDEADKRTKQEETMKKLDSLVQILDKQGMTRNPNKQ